MGEGRSLAETPTWSVATVTTAMIAVCFMVERCIYRFAKWLKKTKRKAMLAALEKIREELMLLGLISLMLSQTARWISEICVPSSLFNSRFYTCTESDFHEMDEGSDSVPSNQTKVARRLLEASPHHCAEDHEPFVSFEGLEQLHRFVFILGITHVLYSFVTVVLSMIKIYSWRKWENQAHPPPTEDLQEILYAILMDFHILLTFCITWCFLYSWQLWPLLEQSALATLSRRGKMMKKQSTFVFQRTSHPWSKNRILIWMLCFIRQFKGSLAKSDYMALRLGFISNHKLPLSYDFHKYMVRSMEDEFHGSVGISWPLWVYGILCIFVNIHGINIYFWLSFVPAILVMLVGTKLQHVIVQLALEVVEATGPFVGTQLKPRDDLFWFGKPELLLWLIQFISFQNAFEMAAFIWSQWELSAQSCFMKNYYMVVLRLVSGLLVQFWCSYSTLPFNVIITQMGSKFKKSLIAESVRESLHSWCRRVKKKSKREPVLSLLGTATSTCSLESTMDETDDTITVGSGIFSRSSSEVSLEALNTIMMDEQKA